MTAATVRRAVVVAAVSVLLGAAPAHAGGEASPLADTSPDSLRIESADVSRYPVVELDFTAPSSAAGIELEPSAFTLAETGEVRPVELSRLPGSAQEVVLVIDVSGSMSGAPLAAAKAAASQFVERAPQGAQIAVVAFGTTSVVAAGLTADTAVLLGAIARLTVGGDTALFDAVAQANQLVAAGPATIETIIVLSDGDDTASIQTPAATAEVVAASGATFVGVQFLTSAREVGDLAALATAASTTLITADDPDGLAAAYVGLAVNSGNRYRLSYVSGAAGPTELDLTLQVANDRFRVDDYVVDLPPSALPAASSAPSAVALDSRTPAEAAAGGGVLGSPLALVAGLLACLAALAVGVVVVLPAPTRRLSSSRLDPVGAPQDSLLTGTTARIGGYIDRGLTLTGWVPIRASQLERAGISARPQDVVLVVASAALAGAAAGLVLAGPLVALLAAVAMPFAARMYLNLRAGRRKAKFADQLDDTLQLVASGLRAGHSLLRSVDAVSREAEAPTGTEFARVINETRLGRDLGAALDDTATRMGSDDFIWVAQAVAIHREVGGNLAEVLDEVGNTIRERNQIRRQVKALSAEGKLSAIVLMSLPVGVVGFLLMANPTYVAKFTQSALGYGLLAAAATLMLVGGLWLRKLVSFQF